MKPYNYKKIFYFTLAISVLVTLIIAGKFFTILFLSALGLWLRRNIVEKENKVEAEINKQQQSQTQLFNKTLELKNWFDQLKNSTEARRKGRKTSFLLLFILIIFTVMDYEPVHAADNLYIPESYEELRELYILADREVTERDELIGEYQALISDYEKNIQELNLLVQRLQELNREKDISIATKDKIIALQKKPTWGITGGLTVSNGLGYTLGIIRVHGSWGWLINYSPSGLLSLGLSIYL